MKYILTINLLATTNLLLKYLSYFRIQIFFTQVFFCSDIKITCMGNFTVCKYDSFYLSEIHKRASVFQMCRNSSDHCIHHFVHSGQNSKCWCNL